MPLVTIFAYIFGLSFLAALAGIGAEEDPPMRAVLAAFAFAGLKAVCFVGASALALPAFFFAGVFKGTPILSVT